MVVCALAVALVGVGGAQAGSLLREQDVKRVLSEHAHEVRHCYERHGLKQRDATGRLTLRLVVTATGGVKKSSVEVEAPGVRGPKLLRCLAKSARAWQFPESRSPTMVEYPFLFQHTRRR
jgi:hypothetical protein